jgi:hypothetical protein
LLFDRTVSVTDRRRLGLVNVVCVIVLAFVGGKRRQRGALGGGWARDLKVGQLILSTGSARGEVRSYVHRATIRIIRGVNTLKYLQNTSHAIIECTFLVEKVKFSSPLQVKNKPRDGEKEHAFILGSMDCTAANSLNSTNRIVLHHKSVDYQSRN